MSMILISSVPWATPKSTELTQVLLQIFSSFPCKQEGLAVGKLANWTKGFKCSGVEGEDVVGLLKKALQRRGDVNIEVKILNHFLFINSTFVFENYFNKFFILID